MRARSVACLGALLSLPGCLSPEAAADVPPVAWVSEVVAFSPGPDAGFGADLLPDVVLGPPDGAGGYAGSLDVVSLGTEGEIQLALSAPVIDGPGPDLVVFENPFSGWIETGELSVSADGTSWQTFACDPTSLDGCAGIEPVFADLENLLDPRDPASGGDRFDLADVGASEIRFVRLRDTGANASGGTTSGFDLDAVAGLHQP